VESFFLVLLWILAAASFSAVEAAAFPFAMSGDSWQRPLPFLLQVLCMAAVSLEG
jgi:hypothetical protein